jgi:hypothetical protein
VRPLAGVALALALAASPAFPHHVGTYTARDNEISRNFKQVKFALQARKFDVALGLYEDGAVRREIQALAGRVPAGLDAGARAALRAGDAPRAEAALGVVFAALARDLAVEAQAKLGDAATPAETRRAAATRFLEAIWRYWSLIDFLVSQRDPKAAVAVRLAFDEAETLARGTAAQLTALATPLGRLHTTLTGVVQTLALATRRDP